MNEERLRRLHRLRKADTDERALAVARDEARLIAAQAAEAESVRVRDGLRARLAAASGHGRSVTAEALQGQHEAVEHGVRAVVRSRRRVAESDRLLAASREAVRRARTEEERVEVLLVEAAERRRRETEAADEKERDEIATIRRPHAVAEGLAGGIGGEEL